MSAPSATITLPWSIWAGATIPVRALKPMRAKPPSGTAKQPSTAGIPWRRIILAVYTAMAAA